MGWNHQDGCVYGFKLPTPLKFNIDNYCWWKRSCTSLYGECRPTIIYRIWCISTSAGLLPSIVSTKMTSYLKRDTSSKLDFGIYVKVPWCSFFKCSPPLVVQTTKVVVSTITPQMFRMYEINLFTSKKNGLGCTSPNPIPSMRLVYLPTSYI